MVGDNETLKIDSTNQKHDGKLQHVIKGNRNNMTFYALRP
jgi:hypothetical protein